MRYIKEILKDTTYKQENIEEFWIECYYDFLYFAKHVLGFKISSYHKEWYELVEKYPRVAIMAFRGSGKTFFFSGYFIWKALFCPGTEFLVISNKLEQAKYIMKVVRSMVLDNEILNQFAPKTREVTWKATELTFTNKSVFYCRAYNENVRSLHPDFVLTDECGEYEEKTTFYTAVLGTIQLKRGKVIAIGTPKSAVDLLSDLKENEEYVFREYPIIVDGKSQWEEMYTIEDKDTSEQRSIPGIRREMGELKFMQEYLLVPMSAANSLFPFEMTTKCMDKTSEFDLYGRKNRKYYMGYDIANSPKGDYTVLTLLDVNEDRKRVALIKRFRTTFDEQKKIFKKLVEDFNPVKIAIDGTGIGTQQSEELAKEFYGVEIVKFTYDNKFKMLMDLRREFERARMEIPCKPETESGELSHVLLKELNEFSLKVDTSVGNKTMNKFVSGKNDDTVISLALANFASLDTFGVPSFRSI